MKAQPIYWGDIFCGNVGPLAQPPLHCLHGHRLRRVENNPERGNWDYVCVRCSQLVTPIETPMPELTPEERAEGVIGRITALPVTIGARGAATGSNSRRVSMKARIVILPAGQISIFVEEGNFEDAKQSLNRFLAELEAQGFDLESPGEVEQHRHLDSHQPLVVSRKQGKVSPNR